MKPKKLSDQIRAFVDSSGHSRYEICKATGLDQGAMSHFIAGRRGLSLDSLDKLAEFLNLRIVSTRPREQSGRRASQLGKVAKHG
jgi:hypothetical protein